MRHGFIIDGLGVHGVRDIGAALVAANSDRAGLNIDAVASHEPAPTASLKNRPFLEAVVTHFCASETPVADLSLEDLFVMISNNDDATNYFTDVHIPMFSKGMDVQEMHRREALQLKHMAEWKQFGPRRLMLNGLVPRDH